MLPAVSVKTSPESDAADKFLLHEGTKVEIEDVINDWAKIKIADGNTGWTETSNIETI
jgi:SH3-like domain-containing protein